jgi:hypothetical protein
LTVDSLQLTVKGKGKGQNINLLPMLRAASQGNRSF